MGQFDQGTSGVTGLPPVEPGEMFVEPAKWPKVLGIFSIVQGSLGVLLNSCCGIFLLIGPSFLENMIRNLPKDPNGKPRPGQNPLEGADTFALMKPWMAAQGVVTLVILATSVWLLIAGVHLVRRKPASVGMHKGWAWTRIALAIVMGLVGIASTVMTAERQAEIKVTYGGSATATGVMVQGLVIGIVINALILVYPIVVLVVLKKPWAKSEISRWRTDQTTEEADPFADHP